MAEVLCPAVASSETGHARGSGPTLGVDALCVPCVGPPGSDGVDRVRVDDATEDGDI